MMYAPRLNPWDVEDTLHDEELPDYDADAAPAYDGSLFDEPLMTYHLRQYDRKIQILREYGANAASSYRVTTNTFRLFSKKPEMEMLYTSADMKQRNIAMLQFDKDGPLPWCPRAHFDYIDSNGAASVHKMEARNFADWTIVLEGRRYEWTLSMQPSSLVLREEGAALVIARFTYSSIGTNAMRGAQVGELVIFRDALTMELRGIDMVACSLMLALKYMQKMGRMYHNPDGTMRAGSATREHIPANRMSSAGVSMI
ncbi:hypothetical protein DE146DRAFT_149979 [Phaeosphaeria sp. MPI-PUGE-AT-0046c]|nr:hypothetical protein DE146DRAFT_149979 [Phaeosphaeria sp. MPI-PUGE-AT-0046c]